jgi:hypothetical protein
MTYSVQDLNQMDYERFTKLVEREFLQHPIVVDNRFTKRRTSDFALRRLPQGPGVNQTTTSFHRTA